MPRIFRLAVTSVQSAFNRCSAVCRCASRIHLSLSPIFFSFS